MLVCQSGAWTPKLSVLAYEDVHLWAWTGKAHMGERACMLQNLMCIYCPSCKSLAAISQAILNSDKKLNAC